MAGEDGRRAAHRAGGRYEIFGPIAAGGMATVHWGKLVGPAGFSRVVAVKRAHPNFASQPEFVAAFVDEARLAARVRHPNVVPIVDVLSDEGELLLVMDYVHGVALSELQAAARDRGELVPCEIAAAIACHVLHGLHAAHEATDEHGQPLGIVHRDVSPHNVLVGADGVARVVDFGVAKAAGRLQKTGDGQVKGKVAYMSPEQILTGDVTRRSDVYAVGVVTWELLTGRRCFQKDSAAGVVHDVLEGTVDSPSRLVPAVPEALSAVVMQAMDRDARRRPATARDMAIAIEAVLVPAPTWKIGEWMSQLAGDTLARRSQEQATVERAPPASGRLRVSSAPVARPPDLESGSARRASLETMPEGWSPPHAPRCADEVAPAAATRRVTAWPIVALVALAASLVAGVVALRARTVQARATDPAPPVASAATSLASAPPVTTEAPSAAVAPMDLAPAPQATVPHRAPRSIAPVRPRPSCDPPYVVDSAGIRYPKPECLR